MKRVRVEIKKSPIKWVGKKVKAHQDDNEDVKNLYSWAKANIMADKQAKAHLRRVMRQETLSSTQSYQNEGWTVQIGNKQIITRHFEKQLIYHCTKTDIKWYWCERFDIDLDRMRSIDWKVFSKTTSEMSAARRLSITKHAAGILVTGQNMLRR